MERISPLGRSSMCAAIVLAAVLAVHGQDPRIVTYTPLPPPAETLAGRQSPLQKTQIDPAYATLYGGNGYDELLAHAVWQNVACMVGVTNSTNLTLFAPFQGKNAGGFDGWIGCGDIDTGLPYFASYLGSTGDSETITGVDIHDDMVFVVGVTNSASMPGSEGTYQEMSGGGQDCFISRMNVYDGSGLKTTLFGREGDEYCSDISVNRHGIWIGGTTNMLIDLVNPLQDQLRGSSDAMVALLRRDLSSVGFATLLGGDDADGGERIGVTHHYDHVAESKFDGTSTVSPPAQVYLTGWSRGGGGPVTENAYQATHGGGLDAFYASLTYDYDSEIATLDYFSYAGKDGDEVPRDMEVSKYGVSFTGWTTSSHWNTSGRARNSGSSDGFLFAHSTPGDETVPYIGYVGPSNTYNLPLAFARTRTGISVVAGYADVPSSGNAFLQAYDRDYSLVATEFAGGAAPADFNTVEVNPFYWAGGGKTGGPIPTTQLAIQSEFGGGDFDMFGSKYRAPWGYQAIYNLTNNEITLERNGSERSPIGARSQAAVDVLGWNFNYQYLLSGGGRTYSMDRLLDETSEMLNYTYLFEDRAETVAVPMAARKQIGILAYNELARTVDVIRMDQTIEHNEISRTAIEPGQYFYVPLDSDQNLRISDGVEFIDYRPSRMSYRSDFPYLAGVLQTSVMKGAGAQNFELVLFDAGGSPVDLPVVTAVKDQGIVPSGFTLHPSHPNPFNESTTIRFEMPKPALVRLTVYDIMGRRVRTLIDGIRTAGEASVEWDGRSEAGSPVSSGTYLYRLEAGGLVATAATVLAR